MSTTLYNATTLPLYDTTPHHTRYGLENPLVTLAKQVAVIQEVEKEAKYVFKNSKIPKNKAIVSEMVNIHAATLDAVDECVQLLQSLQPMLVSFEKLYDELLTNEQEETAKMKSLVAILDEHPKW